MGNVSQFGPALPCPTPNSWGRRRAWEERHIAGLPLRGKGVWWSPEEANGKEEDTSPFGIHPRWSPPQTLGALQTGWRWGQGEQGQSAGTGPCSAWSWLGEGAFLEEAPSLEISSEQGEENPREGNHGYSLLESLFGVISQQQQIMDCRNKKVLPFPYQHSGNHSY